MNAELENARLALIGWMKSNNADASEQALVNLKNRLRLCAYNGCLEEAHIIHNHRKYCNKHYKFLIGE